MGTIRYDFLDGDGLAGMRAHERFAEAIEKHVGMHAQNIGETKGVWINPDPEVIRMAQEGTVEGEQPGEGAWE